MSVFPVDEYLESGGLQISQKVWCKFCIKVAEGDLVNLSSVLGAAQSDLDRLEAAESKVPALEDGVV
jgi:hypothetical protein